VQEQMHKFNYLKHISTLTLIQTHLRLWSLSNLDVSCKWLRRLNSLL